MISSFSQTVPVLFGAGASLRTGLKVKELELKKVLCVYDLGVKEAGIADRIVDNLEAAKIQVVIYDGVEIDPPDTIINRAAEMTVAEQVDGIVAVGGGSTMDTAKGINVLLTNPPPISLYYEGLGNQHKPGKALVLLPTTAGTGSEVTPVSVISDTETGSKKGVIGPGTTAALAIVDPELLLGLPPELTAATGMDAFSHAVEALTSEGMTLFSDVLAEKAIQLIRQNLVKSVRDGSDLNARTNMSFASLIAGFAFADALPHWGHAVAHALGARYHIPHGVGCALALPAAVEHVAGAVPEKMKQVARAMGLSFSEEISPAELGAAVAEAVRAFSRQVGIPGLRDFQVDEVTLNKLPPDVLADDCAMFGPNRASKGQVLTMLQKVLDY